LPQKYVYSNRKFNTFLGNSRQGQYIKDYINALNAKRCVIENEYIDKDYTIDFQRYYARAHKSIPKYTKRVHFFSKSFSNKDFIHMLKGENGSLVGFLKANYLGFVVVKPIVDYNGDNIIGRTCLKTYPLNDGTMERHYLSSEQTATLYGVPLSVMSAPYQAQDRGVSACATVALWTALNMVSRFFNISKVSPVEITERSSTYPSRNRIFPQNGLTIEQMIICLRSLDLDAEVINITQQRNDFVLKTAVKAYSNIGIPLIYILELTKQGTSVLHAAVNTGYKTDQLKNIVELFIHDDQIGPYNKVLPLMPANNLRFWDNEWKRELGFDEVRVDYIIVPIYHKMRLEFNKIFSEYVETIRSIHDQFREDPNLDDTLLDLELYLYTIQNYKNELFSKNIHNKEKILTKTLPRFLWIMRFYYNQNVFLDQIFDGTAIYPTILENVSYY